MTLSGTSMLPAFRHGDVLVALRLPSPESAASRAHADAPALGDLLVLDMGGAGLVVHRLLWKERSGVRTRGDGLPQADKPVGWADVLGRVVRVVRDGSDVTPGRARRWLGWAGPFATSVGRMVIRRLRPR